MPVTKPQFGTTFDPVRIMRGHGASASVPRVMPRPVPEPNRTRQPLRLAALLVAGLALAAPGHATEGGSGAYLLGTRDTLAGIVPPPGSYVSVDVVNINGTAPLISIGGAVVADPAIDIWVTKLNFTHSFAGKLFGGRFAVTFTQPVVTGSMTFFGTVANGLAGQFSDDDTGLGDTTITTSLGYDDTKSHWNFQLSLYVPTGYYEPARVTLHPPGFQVLSFGKNRVAIDPAVAYTYLDMKNGREFSAVAGITISAINTATDYQTAPEFHVEAAALQHLKNGLAFGATGYAYKQTGNDSGSGAAALQAAYGANTLQARVFGAGPIASYSTKIGSHPLSIKGKYTWEFDAQRRFQSDVAQATLAFGF